jgi:hypothetical protein
MQRPTLTSSLLIWPLLFKLCHRLSKISIKENGGLTSAASIPDLIGLFDSTGHMREAKKSSGWKPTGSLQPAGPLHGI